MVAIFEFFRLFGLVCCWVCIVGSSSSSASSTRTLVLVDPFASYLSGACREYCSEKNIRVVEAVSPYCAALLQAEGGSTVPETLCAPEEGYEKQWLAERGLDATASARRSAGDKDDDEDEDTVFVLSESDAGIPVAGRLQNALGHLARGGNGSGATATCITDKSVQNELCSTAGLPTSPQLLTGSWNDAKEFLKSTGMSAHSSIETRSAGSNASTHSASGSKNIKRKGGSAPAAAARDPHVMCIIKPSRGVASCDVHLCASLAEAHVAFQHVCAQPRYGCLGQVNGDVDGVLVQEYCAGDEEYAVDTVSCDGVTRVVALWRYTKVHLGHDAPFVYQCSELVDVEDATEDPTGTRRRVCEYALECLRANGLRWGPAHTEVKVRPVDDQPLLMEINARWHAQHCTPVVEACLGAGADQVTATLQAMFEPAAFTRNAQASPLPPKKRGAGRIIHLVQPRAGRVTAIRHMGALEEMRSVVEAQVAVEEGDFVPRTSDHRQHPGYVLLAHADARVVAEEYATIVEQLQDEIVQVEEGQGQGQQPRGPARSGASGAGKNISDDSKAAARTNTRGWKGASGTSSASSTGALAEPAQYPVQKQQEKRQQSNFALWVVKVRRLAVLAVLSYLAAAVYILQLPSLRAP